MNHNNKRPEWEERLRSRLARNNLHANAGEPGHRKHLHINAARRVSAGSDAEYFRLLHVSSADAVLLAGGGATGRTQERLARPAFSRKKGH